MNEMVRLNLRMPDDLHAAMTESKTDNRRSLTDEILKAIEFYLAHSKDAHFKTKWTPGSTNGDGEDGKEVSGKH